MNDHRKREITLLNKKTKHYRQIVIIPKIRSQGNIPSVMGYRNYFMDKKNPIRAKVKKERNETGSTPMSFNNQPSRRQ